ncbi:TPA: hypothetical protein ACH3X1_011580 [Trebouxia sp. C0004]
MSFCNLAKGKEAEVRSLPDREQLDNDEPNKESVLAKGESMAQIMQLLKNNSLKKAQDRASQLVLEYPVEAKIHADLGGIMYKMRDYESAEVHASVAVLLEPGSYMMRHFRAMCSEKRQDFPAARDDYNVMALQSKQMHEKVAAHKQWQRMGHLIKEIEATQEQEPPDCERSKKSRNSSAIPISHINLDTIRNRSLQLRSQADDIASDALLQAPRNETELKLRPGRNQERPKHRAAHQEMTASANREKLRVSGSHTELQQALLSDQAADDGIFSDVQNFCGQPTTDSLADSTAATEATAHDDSLTSIDVMCEKLHQPSTYRGRPISESSTFWPRTDSLSSSLKPGSFVCTLTKPNLHCDIVTDADLADEAFNSSPESMHEQPDSPFRQRLAVPFCWGAATPVERKQQQLFDTHGYKKAGDEAYCTKRFPEALDQYTKSIVTLPDNAVLLNNRASVYLKLRRWEEARADSTAALCLRPARGNASKAQCRIAKTMLIERNVVGADDVVQIGLHKDPEHTELNALQALIVKIRSKIDPPDQTCCQGQPSHLCQHRPASTSFAKPDSVKVIPDQPGSLPCKHGSAAVPDTCLATKAESTFDLAKPVAEPDIAGSLTVHEGTGVVPVGAIAKATQLYGTSSKRATAIAQAAAAAKHGSASRRTVKPGSLGTLNAKPDAFPPTASHHRAVAPRDSITEAKGHAAKTASGAGHIETADAAALTVTDQESASTAAIRVKSQSMLPEQVVATRTAAPLAAAKQTGSRSVKTVGPSSTLLRAASANPAFARPRPFQPPGGAKSVSGVSHSTRPESASMTLNQPQPAAAVVQAAAAWEGAAVQAVAAPAAASGMTASVASRLQVQSCSATPETSALRDVFNPPLLSDTAVPHALPAKPQPGKKKHAKPRVSCCVAPQAESASSVAAGLGSASAMSVQPNYNISDNAHRHLASHASTMQDPARRISARQDLNSFKQVWSELGGRICNKEECPDWDDAPLLQSN